MQVFRTYVMGREGAGKVGRGRESWGLEAKKGEKEREERETVVRGMGAPEMGV